MTAILHAGSIDEQREIYESRLRQAGAATTRSLAARARLGARHARRAPPAARARGTGVPRWDLPVRRRLPRIGLLAAAARRQLLLARLPDRDLHAGLLPRVSQAGEFRPSQGRAGRSHHALTRRRWPTSSRLTTDRCPGSYCSITWTGSSDQIPARCIASGRRSSTGRRRTLESSGAAAGCRRTSSTRSTCAHGDADGASASCCPTRRPLAEALHDVDRVHTYGSFHIADLAVA